MLPALLLSVSFSSGLRPASRAGSCRAAAVCQDSSEISVLQQMSAAFWEGKRAQLRAESEARLREMDEFVAREQALAGAALGAGAPSSAGSLEAEQLKIDLAAERERVRQLELALAQQQVDSEHALQQVSAYWVAKLDDARAQLPPAATTAGQPGSAAPAEAAPAVLDLVPQSLPEVREDMTLRELRAHLLSYGLSTTGLKSELRARLQQAPPSNSPAALPSAPALTPALKAVGRRACRNATRARADGRGAPARAHRPPLPPPACAAGHDGRPAQAPRLGPGDPLVGRPGRLRPRPPSPPPAASCRSGLRVPAEAAGLSRLRVADAFLSPGAAAPAQGRHCMRWRRGNDSGLPLALSYLAYTRAY